MVKPRGLDLTARQWHALTTPQAHSAQYNPVWMLTLCSALLSCVSLGDMWFVFLEVASTLGIKDDLYAVILLHPSFVLALLVFGFV